MHSPLLLNSKRTNLSFFLPFEINLYLSQPKFSNHSPFFQLSVATWFASAFLAACTWLYTQLCWLVGWLVVPFWAAVPKGSMTYAFTQGKYLLLFLLLLLCTPPNLQAHISASKPISQPQGPNPSLEVHIPTSRPKFHLITKILSLRPKMRPHGIWASRLGFEPQGSS